MKKRGVAIILFDRNEQHVLLMKRGTHTQDEPGKWESPGGKLDPGEASEDGIRREVREELGVEIEIAELVYVEDNPTWSNDIYKGFIASGEPRIVEPDKCSAIQWVALSDLAQIDLASYARTDFIQIGFIPADPLYPPTV